MPYLFLFFILPISLSAQLFPVAQEGRWGCIDSDGRWRIPAKYDYIEAFREGGLSRVIKDEQVGLISASGEWLLPCNYQIIHPLSQHLFAVEKEGRLQLINRQQELLLDSLSFVPRYLSQGFFELPNSRNRQLGHRSGGKLSPKGFSRIHVYAGMAAVQSKSGWGLLDSTGKWIAEARFSRWRALDVPYCSVLTDETGNWLYYRDSLWLDKAWDQIQVVRAAPPGFIALRDEGLSRLLEVQNKQFIGPAASAFNYLRPGHYAYQRNGKWGVFTATDSSACFADSITSMKGNLFRAAQNGLWGLANAQGKWILNPNYSKIPDFEKAITLAHKTDGSFDIINRAGHISLHIEQKKVELSGNTLEHRSKESLTRWVFQPDGRTYERADFSNIQRIRFRENSAPTKGPLEIRQVGSGENTAIYQLFMEEGDTARPVCPPIYERIYLPLGLSFYIGRHPNSSRLPLRERGQNTSFGLQGGKKHSMLFDLMDTRTGRRLLRVQELFLQDFDQSPLARCVLKDGFFALIDRSGKLVAKGFTLIKAPSQGLFAAIKAGRWELSTEPDIPRDTLGLLWQINFGPYALTVGPFSRLTQAWARIKDGEWNLLDRTGQAILAQPLSYIDRFYRGQAIAKGKHWGIIDTQGQWLLAAEYDALSWIAGSQQNTAICAKNIDHWGLLNSDGRVVLPSEFQMVHPGKEDLFAVRQQNRWGFAHRQGNIQIPCTFLQVRDFSDGLAAVKTADGWGYIDSNGNWQLLPKYQKAGDFSRGHTWVKEKGLLQLIDDKGNVVLDRDFHQGETAGFGRFWLRNKKGWALYNNQGRVVFKSPYIRPAPFDAYGRASIRNKPKGAFAFSIIDTSGKVLLGGIHKIVPRENAGLYCERRKASLLMDSTGQTRPTPEVLKSDNTLEQALNRSPIKEVRLLNRSKDGVLVYSRSTFRTANYQLLSPHLNPLCEKGFDRAHPFTSGLARVRRGSVESILAPTGVLLQRFKYNEIRAFEQGYARTRLYRSKAVYQRQAQGIIAEQLDYIEQVEPDIFRVERGRALGYLRSDGSWLWPLQPCW